MTVSQALFVTLGFVFVLGGRGLDRLVDRLSVLSEGVPWLSGSCLVQVLLLQLSLCTLPLHVCCDTLVVCVFLGGMCAVVETAQTSLSRSETAADSIFDVDTGANCC